MDPIPSHPTLLPPQRLQLMDCLLGDLAVANLDVALPLAAALSHLNLSLNGRISAKSRLQIREAWVAAAKPADGLLLELSG